MKLLIGLDESEASRHALTVAQKRARLLNAQLHILSSTGPASKRNGKAKTLAASLEEAKMLCNACGIECHTELAETENTPAEDLLAYARNQKIDEIIIGIKRRSQLGKMIFGSTARQVIIEAPCPVLTVK